MHDEKYRILICIICKIYHNLKLYWLNTVSYFKPFIPLQYILTCFYFVVILYFPYFYNIIFCNNKAIDINNIPFPKPIIAIIVDIVYPKQNPLYNIIPNTIGIPYYGSSERTIMLLPVLYFLLLLWILE